MENRQNDKPWWLKTKVAIYKNIVDEQECLNKALRL